jgi:aminocarboxymuconate-semialdehyde decarboxylase
LGAVIDIHTHIVPARLPADPARHARWPSVELSGGDQAAVMIGGKVFRKIDARSWDVERRLSDMHADGIDMQVLSPMPELLSHWLPADDAEYLADLINEQIAGMVCAQDVPRAVRQLQNIKALGFAGIEIGTHINGVPLGSETLRPLYEAAEAMELAIFVHPLHPAGVDRIGAGPEFAAVAAFPLETALASVSLLAAGIPERFPRLKILLSHGGGALSWILPRLDVGWSLGLKGQMQQPPSKTARWFWYDTILYDAAALAYLAEAVGSDHIVVGSDYPFTIMQKQPGAFAARTLEAAALTDNALSFLGRDRNTLEQAAEASGSKQVNRHG